MVVLFDERCERTGKHRDRHALEPDVPGPGENDQVVTIGSEQVVADPLHPDDLETRVLQALDAIGVRLRKFDSEVKLLSFHEGAVQLQLHASGRTRGSKTKNLRSIVEGGMYNLAPDLTSLTILGLEDESSSGFVPLESLLKHSLAAHTLAVHGGEADGAA